jgi:DNA-binding transcriptional LysR family regulator
MDGVSHIWTTMDLSELADFHLVAAHGGFRRASLASGRPKATLSRRVSELEADLGVRLFERGSRSLRLTEEGLALQSQTQGPLSDIAEASETIRGGLSGPRGRLRINVPVLFGNIAMGRLAAAFATAYPQVRIEVTTEDRFVDPVEEGYDVVIRVNPHPNDQLVGRCFLKDHWLLVAPASLARPTDNDRGGELRVPAVVRIGEPGLWKILDGDRQLTFLPDPVLRFSSMAMVRDAVLVGAGAGLLPTYLAADGLADGSLTTWGKVVDHQVEVWVLHTSQKLVSSKVKAFIQFLIEAFPDASWP